MEGKSPADAVISPSGPKIGYRACRWLGPGGMHRMVSQS
jgi:hypothetical protein